MPVIRFLLLIVGLLTGATALHAAENGCQTQGLLRVDDHVQMLNYCLANQGTEASRFRRMCADLKASQLDGVSPEAARKITFRTVGSCPGNFRAACDGAFGEKASLQYMADDSMLKSGMGKLFCQSMEGRWK
ncbi:MAG: hypothetical protein K0S46_2731 [Moraxellaceae bacterium]|nr:hypothetical protein [Moraxellaceae bacterium]